ncbi:MAG: hypothetical protein OXP09_19545 [Gammaproteobacteria bacterium]|nr:hypothetical protein [Gammaproteobacteria bacterium]
MNVVEGLLEPALQGVETRADCRGKGLQKRLHAPRLVQDGVAVSLALGNALRGLESDAMLGHIGVALDREPELATLTQVYQRF